MLNSFTNLFIISNFSSILDWVSGPELSSGDDSSRWDHRVGSNGATLFQLRSFKDNALETDIDLVVDGAAIQGAVVADVDVVTFG